MTADDRASGATIPISSATATAITVTAIYQFLSPGGQPRPAPLWNTLSWEDDLIMTGVRSFDVKAYDNALGGYGDLGWGDDLRTLCPYSELLRTTSTRRRLLTAQSSAGTLRYAAGTHSGRRSRSAGVSRPCRRWLTRAGCRPWSKITGSTQYPSPTYVNYSSFVAQYPATDLYEQRRRRQHAVSSGCGGSGTPGRPNTARRRRRGSTRQSGFRLGPRSRRRSIRRIRRPIRPRCGGFRSRSGSPIRPINALSQSRSGRISRTSFECVVVQLSVVSCPLSVVRCVVSPLLAKSGSPSGSLLMSTSTTHETHGPGRPRLRSRGRSARAVARGDRAH